MERHVRASDQVDLLIIVNGRATEDAYGCAASPHSYERASYLRSLLQLDLAGTTGMLPRFLLDCEPTVRLLATRHTPLTDHARRWLTELRDDPIEDDEVRTAAAQRIA
ncbi:hypothetical protein [Dactylosporangium sp. CA-233914]|uniref:hypothetical protein n=1 Tax=Dactylosporangium sp. CA-233914 TaxID=3239934 RepID=UPI003D8AAF8A